MLELVYRIVSKTIAHTGLGVRVPSPVKNINLPFGRFLFFLWEASKLLCLRGDEKAGAICEFEFMQSINERRAWRGGVASGEGHRADL